MELDQYSPELDEVYEDDEIDKPRLWLGLSVGVFVGIVLGVLSAHSIENAFFWIKLGIIVAFISWSLVCLGSLIFRIVNRNLFKIRFAPRLLRVIGLVLLVSGISYLLGLIFNFGGVGVILTLLPTIFLISVFWTKPHGQSYSLTAILIFGTGIFLISFKLFTIPAIIKPLLPDQPVSESQDSDIKLLAFNLRRSGVIPQKGIKDPRKLAKIINDEDVEVVLFQGIPDKKFLDDLLSEIGDDWTSAVSSDDKNKTAIISKFGKGTEVFKSKEADLSMASFEKNGNLIRFVSCEAPSGRKSLERRNLVDWLLKEYRKDGQLIIAAGNFKFNPQVRWTFLSPIITDSISYDRASWKALSLLGEIFGYSPSSNQPIRKLNLKQEWMILSPGMNLVSSSLPEMSYKDGAATVIALRIGNKEKDLVSDNP
tara:strand:- start:1902 stop:3176 length:1275 start_codon:yes stop_codon:yes gene_type:complete